MLLCITRAQGHVIQIHHRCDRSTAVRKPRQALQVTGIHTGQYVVKCVGTPAAPSGRRKGRIYENAVIRMTKRLDSLACARAPGEKRPPPMAGPRRLRLALSALACSAALLAATQRLPISRASRPSSAAVLP